MKNVRRPVNPEHAKKAMQWWNALPTGRKAYYKQYSKKAMDTHAITRLWLNSIASAEESRAA